jgi:hypothetical protein
MAIAGALRMDELLTDTKQNSERMSLSATFIYQHD